MGEQARVVRAVVEVRVQECNWITHQEACMAWLLSSRRNIVLVAVGILIVLDLGRSVYARLAYSQPYEVWDGAPYDLQLSVWPPASNVPAGSSPG